MRIVRLANFVSTRSGGLRTALRNLGEGYQRAGHEAVLIVPGRRALRRDDRAGPGHHAAGRRRCRAPAATGCWPAAAS